MNPGLHDNVPHDEYLRIPAIGSTHLGWLSVSPLNYRWRLDHPEPASSAMDLGTALHMATLEPERFERVYVDEPDPRVIAPDAASPRATKAYKEAIASITAVGKLVLKAEQMMAVRMMAAGLRTHAVSAAALARAPRREVTAVFERDGRRCRARFDALGDGIIVDVKTTRTLRTFSPYVITDRAYHLQAAAYRYGARACGVDVKHVVLIAVENAPPYDVGCFVMDEELLELGDVEIDNLLARLAECERADRWPGMFEDLQVGRVTERVLQMALEGEAA